MSWAVVVVRTLVGLGFFVSGLSEFVPLFPPPDLPKDGPVAGFIGALAGSGYLKVVKVLELTGGLLLLTGRVAPLGITLLMPVAVNILLFEVFLAHTPVGPGSVLTALLAFLIWGYWRYFAPVFTVTATTTRGGWLARLRG